MGSGKQSARKGGRRLKGKSEEGEGEKARKCGVKLIVPATAGAPVRRSERKLIKEAEKRAGVRLEGEVEPVEEE